MRHLVTAIALLAALGTHQMALATDGGGDADASATDDATDDEPEDSAPAKRASTPPAAAAKDPFALPPELQGPFHVNALPDPNRTVEQAKAEAEAAVQQMLQELGPNPTAEQVSAWMQRHNSNN